MNYIFGRNEWTTLRRGQEHCYLLTNGLGGYSSLSIAGSGARNDQALLMAAIKAPTQRCNLISNTCESIEVGGNSYSLYSQEFYGESRKESDGYHYLNSFTMEDFPCYTYQTEGIELVKTIVMVHGENTVGIRYQIHNPGNRKGKLTIRPLLQFTGKGMRMPKEQKFDVNNIGKTGSDETAGLSVEAAGIKLYLQTDGEIRTFPTEYLEDLYYERDERDGRDFLGIAAINHEIVCSFTGEEAEFYMIYSKNPGKRDINRMLEAEKKRQEKVIGSSGLLGEAARQLVKGADQFLALRDSTNGKTILAGYPFFGDWGRDTMIAMMGCTLSTKRYADAKSILKTFMAYCREGLMPNLFPEGEDEPLYNTADASLLFIGVVYQYYVSTKDRKFLEEAYPVMEEIISWYEKGTKFHIKMDTDGLIMAGAGLEQVTWMDIRFEDILPTPRHGKPVEINAYWYNALRIMEECSKGSKPAAAGRYRDMAEKCRNSFLEKFWNEEKKCLRDVISPLEAGHSKADDQIRCNQIWALSQTFCMPDEEQAAGILQTVFEELYTPYGLRSLTPGEDAFCPVYKGPQSERDMAYHQGTVWAFPLGAYYLACLRYKKDKKAAAKTVRRQLTVLEAAMAEGCIGQIAEIYDGRYPSISKGCFAQAWSVGELLRVYEALEQIENQKNKIEKE